MRFPVNRRSGAAPRNARGGRISAQGATRRRRVKAEPRPALWLNRLLIVAGIALVGAAGARAWTELRQLPVAKISVLGQLEHTRAEAVQELVHPALGGGFLGADLGQIRGLLEALPWVYRAGVRRRWPDTLEIEVVEQLPIARWGEDGFLNHEGQVFHSPGGGRRLLLPLLRGPAGSERELVATYQRLHELLSPLALGVTQLTMDELGQLEATLAVGARLMVGSNDFIERVQRFAAVYSSELVDRAGEIESVDLRYSGGVAVAFREPPQVAGLPGAFESGATVR